MNINVCVVLVLVVEKAAYVCAVCCVVMNEEEMHEKDQSMRTGTFILALSQTHSHTDPTHTQVFLVLYVYYMHWDRSR